MALRWPYWTISGEHLMEMMQRVADGESPDVVYAEYYANSEHEYHRSEDDG